MRLIEFLPFHEQTQQRNNRDVTPRDPLLAIPDAAWPIADEDHQIDGARQEGLSELPVIMENTGGFVDEIFNYIISHREFSNHGSSLEEFLIDYEDTPWWNEDKTEDELVKDPQFLNGFHVWLGHRYKYAVRQLREEIHRLGGFPLTVYREMYVRPDWNPVIDGVGSFWALKEDTYAML